MKGRKKELREALGSQRGSMLVFATMGLVMVTMASMYFYSQQQQRDKISRTKRLGFSKAQFIAYLRAQLSGEQGPGVGVENNESDFCRYNFVRRADPNDNGIDVSLRLSDAIRSVSIAQIRERAHGSNAPLLFTSAGDGSLEDPGILVPDLLMPPDGEEVLVRTFESLSQDQRDGLFGNRQTRMRILRELSMGNGSFVIGRMELTQPETPRHPLEYNLRLFIHNLKSAYGKAVLTDESFNQVFIRTGGLGNGIYRSREVLLANAEKVDIPIRYTMNYGELQANPLANVTSGLRGLFQGQIEPLSCRAFNRESEIVRGEIDAQTCLDFNRNRAAAIVNVAGDYGLVGTSIVGKPGLHPILLGRTDRSFAEVADELVGPGVVRADVDFSRNGTMNWGDVVDPRVIRARSRALAELYHIDGCFNYRQEMVACHPNSAPVLDALSFGPNQQTLAVFYEMASPERLGFNNIQNTWANVDDRLVRPPGAADDIEKVGLWRAHCQIAEQCPSPGRLIAVGGRNDDNAYQRFQCLRLDPPADVLPPGATEAERNNVVMAGMQMIENANGLPEVEVLYSRLFDEPLGPPQLEQAGCMRPGSFIQGFRRNNNYNYRVQPQNFLFDGPICSAGGALGGFTCTVLKKEYTTLYESIKERTMPGGQQYCEED